MARRAGAERLGITIGEFLPLSARRHPDRPCLEFPDGTAHSFAMTNSRVNRLVSALRAEGVGRGDRLAVFALDSHRYLEIVLACMKLGAVYVPLNYRLQRPEVDVLLRRSAPVALFHDVRYRELPDAADEHASCGRSSSWTPPTALLVAL